MKTRIVELSREEFVAQLWVEDKWLGIRAGAFESFSLFEDPVNQIENCSYPSKDRAEEVIDLYSGMEGKFSKLTEGNLNKK